MFRHHMFIRSAVVLAVVASLVAGCAAPRAAVDPVFFPAPPSKPRLQFLKSYNKHSDIIKRNSFQLGNHKGGFSFS